MRSELGWSVTKDMALDRAEWKKGFKQKTPKNWDKGFVVVVRLGEFVTPCASLIPLVCLDL